MWIWPLLLVVFPWFSSTQITLWLTFYTTGILYFPTQQHVVARVSCLFITRDIWWHEYIVCLHLVILRGAVLCMYTCFKGHNTRDLRMVCTMMPASFMSMLTTQRYTNCAPHQFYFPYNKICVLRKARAKSACLLHALAPPVKQSSTHN